jgi:hypothetical protein
MKTECNRLTKGWSMGLADGQGDSTLTMGWRVKAMADGQPEDRPMKRKKVAIEKIRQKESMVEAGQSTNGDGSKSQF